MKNSNLTYGILTGLAVVGYLLLFYVVEKSSVRGLTATWSSLLIYLIGMALATLAARKNMTTEVSSLSLIKSAFMVWLIANAFYYVFFYAIMMYDAELLQLHQQLTYDSMLEFYKGNAEYINAINKNKMEDYTPTIRGSIFQYVKGTIGGFLLSLLIAEVVKRGTVTMTSNK